MGHIKRVPIDDDGRFLIDRWSEIGTKAYANVDSVTGVNVSLTVDCKGVLIIPSAAATISGTITGYTDAVPFSSPLTLPVCNVENTTYFNIKSAGANQSVYIIFGR